MPDFGLRLIALVSAQSDMQNTELVTECRYFLSILCPLVVGILRELDLTCTLFTLQHTFGGTETDSRPN
jgi:hypothetical protein